MGNESDEKASSKVKYQGLLKMKLTQEERILNFQNKIIERKADGVTWVETISDYCIENQLDYEDAVKLISPWLRTQLTEEAIRLKTIRVSEDRLNRVAI
jgi:hypothetical protein